MKVIYRIQVRFLFSLIIVMLFAVGCGGGGSSSGSGTQVSNSSNIGQNGSLTLSWDQPSLNTDGTQLTDLAGYKIYYGTSSNNYTESMDAGSSTTATINNLPPGLWCFAATAYNSSGNESGFSSEICVNI